MINDLNEESSFSLEMKIDECNSKEKEINFV